jgi:excisionase family DNA binding protein
MFFFYRKGEGVIEVRGTSMAITISGQTLYSVSELSQKLNVTTVTIRNYIKQGRLRGHKAMGRWFIAEQDMVEFFNSLQ